MNDNKTNSLNKLTFKNVSFRREGIIRIRVRESLELQLVDILQEVWVQRRQQRLVCRECAFEVRNVHRMTLKKK